MQKPIVSTTVGAEGFPVVNGKELILADTPAAFAREVLRLLESPTLRAKLALAGQSFARAGYGWDMLVPHLEKIYQQNPHPRQTAGR